MSRLSETVLYILGATIAIFCDRSDQQKLIKLYPYITHNNNTLKWKLFASESLRQYIDTEAIPTFTKIFKPTNSHDDNNPFANTPNYEPFSLTIFNINGINANDINDIPIPLTQKSYPFDSFKSFMVILIIEELYKTRFKHYKYGNSLNSLHRESVNQIINIRINKNELFERIKKKYSEYDNFVDELHSLQTKENGCLLHIYKNSNEKFDFELRVVKEIKNQFDFDWFKQHLINIKNNTNESRHQNESFSYLLNGRLNSDNELQLNSINHLCQILNAVFLSELHLFNDLIIMYGEEAYVAIKSDDMLTDILDDKCRLFATMDVLLIAISPNFDKVVLIQCLLEKRMLSLKSSSFYYSLLDPI